jgi:hypothetical protein
MYLITNMPHSVLFPPGSGYPDAMDSELLTIHAEMTAAMMVACV